MGLIARALEEAGVATVRMVMRREVAENVKPLRALFVEFPFGALLGPADDKGTQRRVIMEALTMLITAAKPGTIIDSDLSWKSGFDPGG